MDRSKEAPISSNLTQQVLPGKNGDNDFNKKKPDVSSPTNIQPINYVSITDLLITEKFVLFSI